MGPGGDFAKLRQGGIPIAAGGELIAGFAFGDRSRPGDDGWDANPSFVEAELGSTMRSGAPAAVMRSHFFRGSVVRLENDNRVLGQACVIDLLQESANPVIGG